MPTPKTKAASGVSRDPERTRRRILDSALKEFSRCGFAGARVDTIARRAGVNKRMLYHYFTDKKGLFSAVLREKITRRQAQFYGSAEEFIASLPEWFAKNCSQSPCRSSCTPRCPAAWFAENTRNEDWVRMLAWEGLQTPDGPMIEQKLRRQATRRAIAHLRQDHAAGKAAPAFSPEYLQLAMVSLSMFPLALPQLVRLIVGCPPSNPKFQRNYGEFLKQFAGSFRPQAQG